MALLFMESFDHYVTADLTEKWTASGSSGTGSSVTVTASGRHSSSSFRWTMTSAIVSNETGYAQRTLTPADATGVLGMAVTVSASLVGSAGIPLAQIRDGTTAQVTLRLNSDGTLSVLRGAHLSSPTVLGTSSATLTFGTFSYIEWKVLIHPSAGTVDVRVNGASVLSLTSQNTRSSATSQWTSVIVGNIDVVGNTTTNTAGTIDFDDLYVLDGSGAAPLNDFLGDCRVDARYPTAAGASTGWTPSTGANWSCVDETAPNDDTDYVTAATSGLTDSYTVEDAPVAGATIYGVQLALNVKKTDAGLCTLAPVVRHSGTNYTGTGISPGTSYAYGLQVYGTNPGTSAAWTESGFNAAEFGVTRTA